MDCADEISSRVYFRGNQKRWAMRDFKDISHIIWDWNGTLFNDIAACVDAENVLLKKYGLPELKSEEKYRQIFTFPVIDYYEALGFSFDELDFSVIAEEYINEYESRLGDCSLHEDSVRVLEGLAARNYNQVLISLSSSGSLERQMQGFDLEVYFSQVLGSEDNLAASKAGLAADWLERADVGPGKALFVGDTLHDYQIAENLGQKSALISAGHQSHDRLERTGAPVFSSLKDFFECFI